MYLIDQFCSPNMYHYLQKYAQDQNSYISHAYIAANGDF